MISTCPVCPQPEDYAPSGEVIDGAVYPLDSQPPIATSKGWGNMFWLLFGR